MRQEQPDIWERLRQTENSAQGASGAQEPVLQSHQLFVRVAISVALLVLLVPVGMELAKWSWSYVREGWETISLLLRRMR